MVALELGMAAGLSDFFRYRSAIAVTLGLPLLPAWAFRRKTSIEERVEVQWSSLDGQAGDAKLAVLAAVLCTYLCGRRDDGDRDPPSCPCGRCGLQQTTGRDDFWSRRHHQ